MKFRCKYRLSDKLVVGAAVNAAAGQFDDASHGTTIEFAGTLPRENEKYYDDTSGSEALAGNADFGTYLDLSTTAQDWDHDGVADVQADGLDSAQVTIQKKDAAGNDLIGAEHDDIVFLSISTGSLTESLISLVNGTASFFMDPSVNVGCEVLIAARSKKSGVKSGSLQIKFVEEGTSSSS